MKVLLFVFHTLPWITPLCWLFVIGGSYKVLKLRRSKNGYKKFKRQLTLFDRLFKCRFVALSKDKKGYQWYFVIMTYVGYVLLLVLIALYLISLFANNFDELMKLYMYIKCYSIELPAFLFTVFNIKRPKDKIGLDWKFCE